MTTRKLTMLSIFHGTGSGQETVFLWVDYVDGKLDFENAREEVHRVRPYWWPDLRGIIPGRTGWRDHVARSRPMI